MKIQIKLPKIPPIEATNKPIQSFSTNAIAQPNPTKNFTPLIKKIPTKWRKPSSITMPIIAAIPILSQSTHSEWPFQHKGAFEPKQHPTIFNKG
jgi:hypothetical protein